MYKTIVAVVASCCVMTVAGQQDLKIKVTNAETREAVTFASVGIRSIGKIIVSDSLGIALFQNLPVGKYVVNISHIGFSGKTIPVSIPSTALVIEIELEP